jgi:parvulin-like peptidyl-prolyl isomerase
MKAFPLFACALGLYAQTAPGPAPAVPDLPDDEVICTFEDGHKFTQGEFKKLYASLPEQMQQMALRDRPEFLHEVSLMRKLTKMAEQAKLDQESPYKEALEFSKMMVLSQAQMMEINNGSTVTQPEIVKEYDATKEKYKQVRVKAIYIAFKKSEDQAKAKAIKLAATARGGADFVALVKENSDDDSTKAKGGDFGSIKATDNIPDAIKTAIFALKQGEVSEPVRQTGGFYVFRCEESSYLPLSQVRDQIFMDLKNKHYKEQMDKLNEDARIKDINPKFLAPGK